ncbi:MAG TPA: hypothetical protein VH415_00900 [Nitrososphaeraceae archaeon]
MSKKKKFQCPHCEHKSARRHNMGVHITRWHDGKGLPIHMEYHNSEDYQGSTLEYTAHLKRVKAGHNYFGEKSGSFPMYNPWKNPESFPGDNTNLEEIDWFDKYLRLTQATFLVKQLMGNSRPPRHEQLITPDPLCNNFDGIIAYRAKTCKICLTIRLIPIVEGQGEVRSNVKHICEPNRISEILRYETDQRNNVASNIEKFVPGSLLRACKEWIKHGVYLRAFPTKGEHSHDIRIDIAHLDKENWLIRTINKSQTSVNDDELLEFLQLAQDQTYTFICLNNSSDAMYNSCYLIAVVRNPF